MPLFNKAHTIRATLESVLRQSYQEIQVVVVDDGSKDTSARIVEKIQDQRITIITTVNRGQSVARNTGIENSTGELIAFIDADDLWDHDHVATLVELYQSRPEAGIYATAYRAVYPRELVLAVRYAKAKIYSGPIYLEDYFRVATYGPYIWVSAVAVPRAVFKRLGMFLVGEHRGADREMWARIALQWKVAYTPRITATYNCASGGQESNKKRDLQFPPLIKLLDPVIQADSNNVSIQNYINRTYFGYAGKALVTGSRNELKAALNQIKPKMIRHRIEKIFWTFIAVLPVGIAQKVVRFWGSRYLLEIRSLFRPKEFSLGRLGSIREK